MRHPPDVLDPTALRRGRLWLAAADPVMARLVAEIGPEPMAFRRGGSAFFYIARAILGQQISVAAARSIANRMTARFGWPWRPEHVLSASDPELRALGLSRQKAAYLRDLAGRTREGLALGRLGRLPDEGVVETLTRVKGVGRWTAEMFLMFRLGRADVLPLDDLGLRAAVRRAYGLRGVPRKEKVMRIAEAWRPYRTLACFYLWRSLERPAEKARPRTPQGR
jgi:3-methyladenine DNA glycosylase/8-oxoguanine DNA glycosylase